MGTKYKNKNSRLSPQEKPKPAGTQEYDLIQSLSRVRPYSRHSKKNNSGDGTYSDEEQPYSNRRGYVSSNSSQYDERTTGAPSWDRYDKLEDRFTSFSDKNEKEHAALRQELESKIDKSTDGIKDEIKELSQRIDKHLPKWVFTAAISVLVVIVGIIWTLSYQEVAKMPSELIKIDGRIEKVENELKEQKQVVDSIISTKVLAPKKSKK